MCDFSRRRCCPARVMDSEFWRFGLGYAAEFRFLPRITSAASIASKYGRAGAAVQTFEVQPGGTHTCPSYSRPKRHRSRQGPATRLQPANVTGKNEACISSSAAPSPPGTSRRRTFRWALKTTVTHRVRPAPQPPAPQAQAGDGAAPAVAGVAAAAGAGQPAALAGGAAGDGDDEEESVPRGFAQLGRHDVQALTSLMQRLVAPLQRALEQAAGPPPAAANGAVAVAPAHQLTSNLVDQLQQEMLGPSSIGSPRASMAAIAADLFSQVNITSRSAQSWAPYWIRTRTTRKWRAPSSRSSKAKAWTKRLASSAY